MKKILIFSIILFACSNNKQKIISSAQDTTIYYPYSPVYSELEKGKPSCAKAVLDVWRAYETGNVSSAAKNFSDSITLIFSDHIFTGGRDSILKIFQNRRGAYASVQSFVDTWLPVHAAKDNRDLVLVWGKLICATNDGKEDYIVLHEVWKFDGSGKIREMVQYTTHPH